MPMSIYIAKLSAEIPLANNMSAMDSVISSSVLLRDDEEEDDTSAILLAKGVTMVCLGVISICIGLLPLQLSKWFKWQSSEMSPRSAKVIELLLGLGGGVLFSTTFLHILPEVSEAVEELTAAGSLPTITVSWAELFMCCGFFLMYFIEELVHIYLRKDEKRRKRIADNLRSTTDVTKSTNELVESGGKTEETSRGYGHGHSHMPVVSNDDDDFLVSSLRGLLIVLGLSIHELFEGLAVGLSSTAEDVWYLFGAVAAHKFVIAFCIGIELVTSRTRTFLIVIYICTYSVVSPLGIGIAMILTGGASAAATGPVAVILQGLATGTLLYVVFFEILRKQRHGIVLFFAVFIGFLIMFIIQYTLGHTHSHSH